MPEASLDIASLMAALKASRESFATAFNAFAAARQGVVRFETLSLYRQQRAPIADSAGRNRADIEEALTLAAKEGFLVDLCRRSGDVLFKGTLDGGMPLAAAVAPDDGARRNIVLVQQKIVNKEPLRDPDAISAGLMRAQRRTCRVVARDGPGRITGTGFLIGPRLVLTNWHVVKTLVDALPAQTAAQAGLRPAEAWTAIPGSAALLTVEFDFTASAARTGGMKPVKAAADWLVAASSAEGHEHEAKGQPADEIAWPADGSAFEPFDDFAVIEIAEPEGLERGFYNLVNREPGPAEGDMVVMHHPGQHSMRLSVGTFGVEPLSTTLLGAAGARSAARVLHTANTIGGSSGGACFNWDMEPVALHQSGLEYREASDLTGESGEKLFTAAINVAIPLVRVARKAGPVIRQRMGSLDKLLAVLSDGAPLIGRADFQIALADARDGRVKIIVVRPDFDQTDERKPLRKVGKSFSKEVLRDYLSDMSQHFVVDISAASLKQDALSTAKAILGAIDQGAVAAFAAAVEAQSGERASTEVNDVVQRIVTELKSALVKAAGARLLWLVIDDLETHSLPDTSTRGLMDRLYAEIAAEPKLRLVLIGLMELELASLQSIADKRVEKPLNHLDQDGVRHWIDRRVDGRIPVPDTLGNCLAGMVTSVADRRVSDSFTITQSVAEVVKTMLEPHLKKGLGL